MIKRGWNPRLFLGILLVSVHFFGTAQEARACSCGPVEQGFLGDVNLDLPRNAKGLPWSGYVQLHRASTPPLATRFRVMVWADSAWRSVPFDLIPVEDVPVGSAQSVWGERLHVVAPRGGLVVGKAYMFSYSSPIRLRRSLGSNAQTVFVGVTNANFLPEAGTAKLSIATPTTGTVTTSTRSGMCATAFTGKRAQISFHLPAPYLRWLGALTYTVIVDGSRVWRPDANLCDPTPPGLNSLGHGQELLFSLCEKRPKEQRYEFIAGAEPDAVLSPEPHDIEVIASLPGTAIRLSAQGRVDLGCGP
jgi:hypothetical protein